MREDHTTGEGKPRPDSRTTRKFFPETRPLVESFIASITHSLIGEAAQTRKLSLLIQLNDASTGSTADEFKKALTAAIDAGASSVNYVEKVLQSTRQRRSEADRVPPEAGTERPTVKHRLDKDGRCHRVCDDVVVGRR